MEKRNVTIFVAGKPCSFTTTDSEEYIRRLEAAANDVVKKTAQATHRSLQSSTLLSVVTLADQIQRNIKLNSRIQRALIRASDQMTIWDVMESP